MRVDPIPEDLEKFATLRFDGDRFSGANLPLDFLDNIAAYQRILREFAVEIWREKNPERARIPQGFRRSLSLSFSEIKDGSANTSVRRDPYLSNTLPLGDHDLDYLSLAQSRFLQVAQAANDNKYLSALPHAIRGDLKLLFSDIAENEKLEVISLSGKDRQNSSVNYTKFTRDRLLSALRVPQQKEITGLGIVSGLDDPREKVKLTTSQGVFSFPVSRNQLREEFSGALNSTIKFSALVKTSKTGAIAEVLDAQYIQRVPLTQEIERLSARLEQISNLRSGWREGEGEAVPIKTMHFARDIGGFLSASYQRVAAFPTLEGGVVFEFSFEEIEISVSVSTEIILLECFDESDADVKTQAFFAVTPKLLSHLSDLKEFMA